MHPNVRSRQRLWLHILLLLLTLLSTTIVGAQLTINFDAGLPAFNIEQEFDFFLSVFSAPAVLLKGLPFSLTLLAILFAHEMGHYLTCVYYRIDASLPYFLPAPTLIGTFGAFIRIRSPIYSRRQLFDIGVAGPIAGFIALLPALGIGLAYSKILPGVPQQSDLIFGTPLLLAGAAKLIFPSVSSNDLYLHPVARAAWVGLFATALNLLPIGQLDGGHILYAYFGRWHRRVSQLFALILALIGWSFGWLGWLLWAAFFLFTGMRHPAIVDETPLGRQRTKLALLAIAILIASFMPVPVRSGASL